MQLASVEGLGVEGDDGRVAALGAGDDDLAAQLHPGHRQDGAGVGTGQREGVLLIVVQQGQAAWGGETQSQTHTTVTIRSHQYILKTKD